VYQAAPSSTRWASIEEEENHDMRLIGKTGLLRALIAVATLGALLVAVGAPMYATA
jgi:hypothetical protein